jgi:ribosomal protein S18 acetylase RimI-like enzyme
VRALDNPVWHALSGPQATLAEGSGGARRYRYEFAPFAALADADDPGAWRALADLVGPDGVALLVPQVEPAPGWRLLRSFAAHQMVFDGDAVDLDAVGGTRLDDLGEMDAPAMAELAVATEPGPWMARTHELGDFVGVRVDGRVVAMAGQRMRLADAIEISAVCTDPDHRGQGLARAAVTTIVARTLAAGRQPFLHVRVENEVAVALYEAIGFRIRTTLRPGVFAPPGT